ncbi:hypothetical protein [Halocatena halophila]|uniref:hypothetical protein n=1 Tax=Halocatena halophila TaxID=2814576 RepID=UPI002ED1506D
MIDTALLWIALTATASVFGACVFFIYYRKTGNADLLAVAWVFVGIAGSIEISMANGYLPENEFFNGLVAGCLGVAVVVGIVGVRRSGTGFQLWNDDVR